MLNTHAHDYQSTANDNLGVMNAALVTATAIQAEQDAMIEKFLAEQNMYPRDKALKIIRQALERGVVLF